MKQLTGVEIIAVANERLAQAWEEIVCQKANADAAIVDRRWGDAENAIRKIRYACSDLECAITEVQVA